MGIQQEQPVGRIFPGLKFVPVDQSLKEVGHSHLDQLTKPLGSLGRLEEVAARLYAIAQGQTPLRVDPALIYTIAADHGVARQGVSPFPQAVTRQMVENFLADGAAISVLCKTFSIEHMVVDAGCEGGEFAPHPRLIAARLGNGSRDLASEKAMDIETALTGLRAGQALAAQAAARGYRCIGLGEMGIANSSAASALFCALYDLPATATVGPGSGASKAMQAHKAKVVQKALELHRAEVQSGDPVRILAALGGFEIAIMAGAMLGCAQQRLPVVVDGFISTAAYAVACAIWAPLKGYAFLSHCSAEPAYSRLMELMGERPLLALEMRLGEGTGCALAINLLRAAAAIFNDMATMSQAGVSATEADRTD